MDNPFADLVPDFTVFGAEFTEWWQKLFTGAWALAIIVAAGALIMALVKLNQARSNSMAGQADEAKAGAAWAAGALVGLVGLGVIVGAIIFIAGS